MFVENAMKALDEGARAVIIRSDSTKEFIKFPEAVSRNFILMLRSLAKTNFRLGYRDEKSKVVKEYEIWNDRAAKGLAIPLGAAAEIEKKAQTVSYEIDVSAESE